MALIFEDDKSDFLPTLHELYKYESLIVAGPHGGRPKFQPWSVHDVVNSTANIKEEDLVALIDELIKKQQIMVIPGNPPRYVTRTSEVVRTIGTMHEYVKREIEDEDDLEDSDGEKTHLQLIEAVKWVPAVMDRPERTVDVNAFLDELKLRMEIEEPDNFPPSVTSEVALSAVEIVIRSIGKKVAGNVDGFKLTRFQQRAICDSLMTSWKGSNQSIIVSAGTGSGKTIAFTVPVLVDALLQNYSAKMRSEQPKWTQLLTYPRNDLAFDQFSTLTGYIIEVNRAIKQSSNSYFHESYLTISVDAGGMIKKYNKEIPGIRVPWDLKKEWMGPGKDNVVAASISRYGGKDPENRDRQIRASNIIIAGLESFRRRMVISEVVKAAQQSLQRVVFDEIHLAYGLEGGHMRGLFNRLHSIVQSSGRNLNFMGASATIAKPQVHVSKVWGCYPDNVLTIEPTEEESKGSVGGIVNHILVRPRTGVSKGGPIYNATSLIGHQSQDLSQLPPPLSGDKIEPKKIEKMICFADSKEFVGRWQMLLNENEGTMNSQSISKNQIHHGTGGAITLPYAHWFDRPMAQILNDPEMCKKCKGGKNEDGSIIAPCKMDPAPLPIPREKIFSFRTKIGGLSEPERFAMEVLPKNGEEFIQVNGLDECPMLQAGVCWWFSGDSDVTPLLEKDVEKHQFSDEMKDRLENEILVKRPNMGDYDDFVFARNLRSRRHTAEQTKDKKAKDGLSTDPEQFSSNKLLEHYSGEAYPPNHEATNNFKTKIPHNVIVATPTLEVGVDMDNVANILMHRAMRDIASYRQKAGRAGREKNSVVNVATVLSKRAQDYEFYNNHGKLILQPIRNAVPIASSNRNVMLSQCYMSVMDFVGSTGINIEELKSPNWAVELDRAIKLLDSSEGKNTTIDWIIKGFWRANSAQLSRDDIKKAVDVFISHLKLMRDTKFTTKGQETVSIIEGITIMHSKFSSFPEVDVGKSGKINNFKKEIEKSIKNNPILDEEILEALEHFVSQPKITIEEVKSLYNKINDYKSDLDFTEKGKLSNIEISLGSIGAVMQDEEIDFDPVSSEIAKEIKDAFWDDSAKYYFSFLLSKAKCFLKDAPYCFVSSIIENPNEEKIKVVRPEGKDISQTINQVMRDLLPGTWNHRLTPAGTGHALRSKVGGAGIDRDGDYDFIMLNSGEFDHNSSPPLGSPQRVRKIGKNAEMAQIPWMVRAGFNENSSPELVKPSVIRLEKEIGMNTENNKNVPGKVPFIEGSGLVAHFDRTEQGTDYSSIPESWPMRWSLYEHKTPASDILSYTPSIEDNPGNGKRAVILHPALHGSFDSIKFGEQIKIKDIVTGVRRSRGIVLRYHTKIDGETKDVVYGESFDTDGIEYRLNQDKLALINNDIKSIESWKFDSDLINMLKHHMERMEIFGVKHSLTINSIIEILIIKLYEQNKEVFPETFGELMHSLGEEMIEPKDQQNYLITVRKNIEKLYQENLDECVPKYNEKINQIWDLNQIKKSAEEWLKMTLLNTIGRGLVSTVSKYSGVQEEKISSSINLQEMSILIYDNEHGGNGTSTSVREHYQITEMALNAQRQMDAPPPPEDDFVNNFERFLTTCREHIVHRVAMLHDSGGIDELPRNMGTFIKDSKHLSDRFSDIWQKLGIKTLRRAGVLSHITPHLLKQFREQGTEITSVDMIDQSLRMCDTGCFACQGSYAGSSFPGILSERFTSRNVLEKYVGLSVDREGYGTQEQARKKRGLVNKGVTEEFPHWKRNENQIFTFYETCVPVHVNKHQLDRFSQDELPITHQLKRLHDSIFDRGDN